MEDDERQGHSRMIMRGARLRDVRSAAIETGAIEGLYTTPRGVTLTVAMQGATWQASLHEIGPDVQGHFEAQLAASRASSSRHLAPCRCLSGGFGTFTLSAAATHPPTECLPIKAGRTALSATASTKSNPTMSFNPTAQPTTTAPVIDVSPSPIARLMDETRTGSIRDVAARCSDRLLPPRTCIDPPVLRWQRPRLPGGGVSVSVSRRGDTTRHLLGSGWRLPRRAG